MRYLCAKHGRTDLYPTELKQRAIVEQWMDYGSTDLYSGMRPVFQGKVVGSKPWSLPEIIAWGAADWNKQMGRVDTHLQAGNAYLAGASFTIADIPAGLLVHRWTTLDFDKPALPALAAYYARLCQRPAYKKHGCNGMP